MREKDINVMKNEETKMEIKHAIDCDITIREKLAELYAETFYDSALQYLSKSKDKLITVFTPMINLDCFYIALIDGEVAGMAACQPRGQFFLHIDNKLFFKHLGLLGGFASWLAHKDYNKKYEAYVDEKTAIIEAVATDPKHKRKGVASSIIEHLFTLQEFNHYFLVLDGENTSAMGLYIKLGFKEIYRKTYNHNTASVKDLVYMKYSK
jgi:ribosomal protein S18 acetylase RimI-like enzyme